MKTYTSLAKRFKITKRGKVIHRTGGQDHFNAREGGKVTRAKRRDRHMAQDFHRVIKESI